METIIGGYKISKISAGEMADYFERAFSRPSVKEMISNAASLSAGEGAYKNFGNILQAYTSATGDLSDETIDRLAKDFETNGQKCNASLNNDRKLEGIQVYFGEHVMPLIVANHCERLGLKPPVSWQESLKLLQSIEMQCKNNRFQTHSFNGALLPEIKEHGFDINKELFREEYAQMARAGLTQPYQKGNLLFCELSRASFGYSLRSPERLLMCVTAGERQGDTESLHSFMERSLQVKLGRKSSVSTEEKEAAAIAAKKVIDFYFSSEAKSAIAFKRNDVSYERPSDFEKRLQSQFSGILLKMKVDGFCNRENAGEMKQAFAEAQAELKESGSFDKMEQCVTEFNKAYPNNKILDNLYDDFILKSVTESCLNNFVYNGNADGYRIDGGILAPGEFAVAGFDNPINVYVGARLQKERNLNARREELMAEEYNRHLYEHKYSVELKSGRLPAESFEEYVAANSGNTFLKSAENNGLFVENPGYTRWKKERGYDNPQSEARKQLEVRLCEREHRGNAANTCFSGRER